MALEKCNECGGQVSTAAAACPHCGVSTGKTSYTTTQATGKKWKAHKLLSLIMFVIGLASESQWVWGIAGAWFIYVVMGAWWHHD